MTLPLLQPDWPMPPGTRALMSLRGEGPADGASRGGYRYCNLGAHVGDDPEAVAANRQRLRQALGARPVYLQQVHGCDVATLTPGMADGLPADAAVTQGRHLACTIMVADCLPILLARTDGRAVGAAHAGWRGLAAGVVDRVVARMRSLPGAADLVAWLGPCIGPAVFEVGAEVRTAFVRADPAATAHFAGHGAGKYLADLPALARQRLAAAGVHAVYGNDGSAGWCTVRNAARYHSFRRDQKAGGASGRMAACIWRL